MRSFIRFYKTIRSRLDQVYGHHHLSTILSQANSKQNLEQKITWLTDLMDWIRLPIELSPQKTKGHIQNARLKYLIHFLERQTDYKLNVSATFQSILSQGRPLDLFCQTGLSQEHGFIRELLDRLFSHSLPRHYDLTNLSVLFERVFYLEEDAIWLSNIDLDTMNALFDLLLPDKSAVQNIAAKMSEAMADALMILSSRVCALSVHQEVRSRLGFDSVKESPFFKLSQNFLDDRDAIASGNLPSTKVNEIIENIGEAERRLKSIYSTLEESGVSIELVYQIESLAAMLERMSILLQLRFQTDGDSRRQIFKFVGDLARSQFLSSSVSELLSTNLNLISKKIVERTGETGEHYLARSRIEYRDMFFSAGGGGLLTVGTTLLKTQILKLNMPLFFEGLFASFNYAGSFIAMQFLHFTLATKAPAMTASTLARKLHSMQGREHLKEFVDEAACLIRSGLIAVVGNVGLVTAGALLVDGIYFSISQHHIYSEEYGLHQMELHNPLTSFSVFYAILTGVILWGSSMIGGWLENWFAYRRIPKAVEESRRLGILLGPIGVKGLSSWIKKNVAGFGTNVSLGFLLGFTTITGKFFGLPFDVRHVTLSSGTLAFGMMGIENKADHIWQIVFAYFGVFLIAILNLGVSFALSLFVASRARNIRIGDFPFLLKVIVRRFLKRPQDFIFPPKNEISIS